MDKWTVIKFIDDGTVEAVPSLWIDGEKCCWPLLTKDKVANAIRQCEPPNKRWPTYNVITFKNGIFDDYTQARKAAKLAQEISDLPPDSESCRKQRRISKIFSNSDESLNKLFLPTPPQIATHSTPNQMLIEDKVANAIRKCEPPNKNWPTHNVITFRNATFDNYDQARKAAKLVAEMRGVPLRTESPKKRRRISQISSSSDDTLNELFLPTPPKIATHSTRNQMLVLDNTTPAGTNPEQLRITNTKSEPNSQEIPSSCIENIAIDTRPSCSGCKKNRKSLEAIMSQSNLIKALMTNTLQEIKKLRDEIQNGREKRETITSIFSKHPNLKFPLNNLEDLYQLEEILNITEDFENGVNELANFGSSGIYNFVKRTLTFLISNDTALQFSWLGRKGKKEFHNLNIARLVMCAAERTHQFQSRKQTEEAIQMWLKRASDRKNSISKKF